MSNLEVYSYSSGRMYGDESISVENGLHHEGLSLTLNYFGSSNSEIEIRLSVKEVQKMHDAIGVWLDKHNPDRVD